MHNEILILKIKLLIFAVIHILAIDIIQQIPIELVFKIIAQVSIAIHYIYLTIKKSKDDKKTD